MSDWLRQKSVLGKIQLTCCYNLWEVNLDQWFIIFDAPIRSLWWTNQNTKPCPGQHLNGGPKQLRCVVDLLGYKPGKNN